MQFEVMEKKSWMHSLGFVDLVVHGKTIQALVDTGATHNFMMTWLAKEVGLMIFQSYVEVKAVNSRARVAGLAHEVPVKIKDRKEVKVQHVSALSLEKAMQESDMETYATIIREFDEDDGVGTPIPTEISEVLAKYADLMPDELLKKLPPRHVVDHNIELEPGKQPSPKAPSRLSKPDLEELKQ
eukprot:PITA_34045